MGHPKTVVNEPDVSGGPKYITYLSRKMTVEEYVEIIENLVSNLRLSNNDLRKRIINLISGKEQALDAKAWERIWKKYKIWTMGTIHSPSLTQEFAIQRIVNEELGRIANGKRK